MFTKFLVGENVGLGGVKGPRLIKVIKLESKSKLIRIIWLKILQKTKILFSSFETVLRIVNLSNIPKQPSFVRQDTCLAKIESTT